MSEPNSLKEEPRWLFRFRRDFSACLLRLKLPMEPLVIAVSGGADSVALVHFLAKECPYPLILAHYNHGLRGQESNTDSQFVSDLAYTLQSQFPNRIHLAIGSPVEPLLQQSGNLEANARNARYEWLIRVAKDWKSKVVLTAHHANDQAETVLFHILRGTGPSGLKGIAPKRKLDPTITLVRPLLEFLPETLRRYLNHFGQEYRQDSTNQQNHFTRNRLRNEIIPQLSIMMGRSVSSSLVGLAWHARNLHRRERSRIRSWISHHAVFDGPDQVTLPVAELNHLGPYGAMAVLEQITILFQWPRGTLARTHYKSFWTMISKGLKTLSLPNGISCCLQMEKQTLILKRHLDRSNDNT